MKKYLWILVVVLIIIAGIWYGTSRKSTMPSTEVTQESNLTKSYSNSQLGFSLKTPQGFTSDETYTYQPNPNTTIHGVKFLIPATLTQGTNLSTDSYISVEQIPQTQNCSANLFLNNARPAITMTDGNKSYSVASTSDAAAGNRYEETVYATPGTNPCIAVRYMIHYGVYENYPEGSIKRFDEQALISQFDEIRRSLVVNH